MSLESRKISLIQALLAVESEAAVAVMEGFLLRNKAMIGQKVSPMSIEHLNDEIDKALEDELNGNLIEANELKSKIMQWS